MSNVIDFNNIAPIKIRTVGAQILANFAHDSSQFVIHLNLPAAQQELENLREGLKKETGFLTVNSGDRNVSYSEFIISNKANKALIQKCMRALDAIIATDPEKLEPLFKEIAEITAANITAQPPKIR